MALISRPITRLLHKNQRFNWTIECQTAFDEIKNRVSSPLELHRPDFGRKFFLQVDASSVGLGAVLFQMGDDGERRIISYASSTLNQTEQKYHANELEVYGALFGIKKYRAYLSDQKFVLITDSRSLYWLERNRDVKAKLTRWSLLLQEYDFEVQHCPGKNNELADFLSRHATPDDDRSFLDEERLLPPEVPIVTSINLLTQPELYEYVKQNQPENHALRDNILVWKGIRNIQPENPVEEKFYRTHVVQEDVLYYKKGEKKLLVIPSEVVPTVISHYHDSREAAHPGIKETVRAIEQLYQHNNLYRKVTRYINNCLICRSVKARQVQEKGTQRPHVATAPFEVISIDVLGPYPKTIKGNRFVFIIEDLFTKWVEAKAVASSEAGPLCDFLHDEIFSRYGYPKSIISDNGPVFTSNKYLRLCERNNITPYYTAVYMQRQNPVERKVQDFKATMCTLLLRTHEINHRWDRYVSQALRAQRTRQNRATGETPSLALLGYELALPGQWEITEFRKQQRTDREDRQNRRQKIRERQLEFNQKNFPNSERDPEVNFRAGETVMVRNYATEPFAPPWVGPYPITQALSNKIFLVDRNGREFRFHIDQLRKAPLGNDVEIPPDDDYDDDAGPSQHTGETDAEDDTRGPAGTGVDYGPPPPGQPPHSPISATSPLQTINSTDIRLRRERREKRPSRIYPSIYHTRIFTPTTRLRSTTAKRSDAGTKVREFCEKIALHENTPVRE